MKHLIEKKRINLFLLGSYMSIFGLAQSPLNDNAWNELTLKSDDFDSLNSDKWQVLHHDHQWGQEIFDSSMVEIVNGILELSVMKSGNIYFTGGIKSRTRNQFEFGYLEVEAKIPVGKGFWPAFWVYNQNCSNQDDFFWYDEIDIIEPYFSNHEQNMNQVNWHGEVDDDSCGLQASGGYTLNLEEDLSNTFHKYAVEWLPDHMVFYFNDIPFFSVFNDELIPEHGVPGYEMQDTGLTVYCDLQINPKHDNPPDEITDLTQKMEINYIKYYELDQSQIDSSVSIGSSTNLDEYNFSIFKSVTFENGTSIPSNKTHTFRATDYIQINNDFTVPFGTEFTLYFSK